MNSDVKRVLSHHDAYHRPDLYQAYYSKQGLWERFQSPGSILAIALVVVTVLYQGAAQQGRVPPLSSFLWDCLVFLIPAKALYTLERWLDPPLFPSAMLQTQTTNSHAAKSDVLRKLLGVDKPGGLLMSVSQAGRNSLAGLSGATLGKNANDQPPGLGNYDNSCYQNSILQSLASLSPLPSYLSCIPAPADGRPVERTTDALRTLISDLNDSSNNGKTLWTPGVLKNMSTWQQQDAQEYYSKLLDEVDKEIAKAVKRLHKPTGFESEPSSDDASASQHSDDSGYQSVSSMPKIWPEPRLSRNPLEGLVAQRVACVACGYCEGLSMIPFNCLTLNLGNRAEHDLYDRLDTYTKLERIDGVECPKCSLLRAQSILRKLLEQRPDSAEMRARLVAVEEALEDDVFDDKTLLERCKIPPKQRVASTKTKQVVVSRPPRSLAIHMNRSVFDERTGGMFKNLAAVRFPKILDLGPWCLGSADDTPSGASVEESMTDEQLPSGVGDEERWLLDPLSSMVAGDSHPSKITGPIYELRAVITHYGRHENGHYVCYRRHTTTGRGPKETMSKKPPQLATEGDDLPSLDGSDLGDSTETEDSAGAKTNQTRESTTAEREEDKTGAEMEVDNGKDDDSAYEDEATTDWWRLSDQDVTKVDESVVLAQGGVFMLFYDCVDPDSIRLSEADAPAGTQSSSSGSVRDTPPDLELSGGTRTPVNCVGDVARQEGLLNAAVTTPLPDDDGDDGL